MKTYFRFKALHPSYSRGKMIDMSKHPGQPPPPPPPPPAHAKRTHPLLEYKNLNIRLGPIIKEYQVKKGFVEHLIGRIKHPVCYRLHSTWTFQTLRNLELSVLISACSNILIEWDS